MEFITWKQFEDYFEKDKLINKNILDITASNKYNNKIKNKIKVQMSKHEQKILKQIFNSLPRSKNDNLSVTKYKFTNACLNDPLFKTLENVVAR